MDHAEAVVERPQRVGRADDPPTDDDYGGALAGQPSSCTVGPPLLASTRTSSVRSLTSTDEPTVIPIASVLGMSTFTETSAHSSTSTRDWRPAKSDGRNDPIGPRDR